MSFYTEGFIRTWDTLGLTKIAQNPGVLARIGRFLNIGKKVGPSTNVSPRISALTDRARAAEGLLKNRKVEVPRSMADFASEAAPVAAKKIIEAKPWTFGRKLKWGLGLGGAGALGYGAYNEGENPENTPQETYEGYY
jgi:hypothetical protein